MGNPVLIFCYIGLNIFIYWHPLTFPGLSWPYGPLLAFLACVSHLISLRFSRSLDDFTSFLFYIPMRYAACANSKAIGVERNQIYNSGELHFKK